MVAKRSKDLTGQRFGKLVAVRQSRKCEKTRQWYWECNCDCGNVVEVIVNSLTGGNTKTCGCSKKDRGLQLRDNLVGQRFGRWLVVSFAKVAPSSGSAWNCVCDCGNTKVVVGSSLKDGKSTSCGCYQKERVIESCTTHNMSDSKIYGIWCAIKARCLNPKDKNYHNYGGRGISIHPEWLDFEVFLRDVGEPPFENATLDRKENDGNYEPGNVVWSTQQEQCRNTRQNRILTFNGKSLCVAEWAEQPEVIALGLKASTIRSRLILGWSEERIFTTPLDISKQR